MLADEGNPRGLAFQLLAMRDLLRQITEEGDSLLASVDRALREAREIVTEVLTSPNQMQAAARLTDTLSALELSIESIADRVSRRYFTLLPIARSLSMDAEPASRSGAA
jgi:uncharacterized alpha-E superfamily protein